MQRTRLFCTIQHYQVKSLLLLYKLFLNFLMIKLKMPIVDNVARQNGGGVFLEANNTVVAYQSLLTRKSLSN